MNVTLLPALTDSEKFQLRNWLIAILTTDRLETTANFPLRDESIQLYVDKRVCRVYKGTWQLDMPYLYLGGFSERVIVRDRLTILGSLVQLCDPSEELTAAMSQAITKYLLGEYRELSSQLIAASMVPTGLAFSEDGRVASLLGEEWMLPSGEIVDVTGWNVCATVLPASEVPAIETPVPPAVDVLFNASNAEPAFPSVETTTTNGFAVGQRVRWTPRFELDPSFIIGEGVITRRSGATDWMITLDEPQMGTDLIYAEVRDLSHI